jgi:hypothetical protein
VVFWCSWIVAIACSLLDHARPLIG